MEASFLPQAPLPLLLNRFFRCPILEVFSVEVFQVQIVQLAEYFSHLKLLLYKIIYIRARINELTSMSDQDYLGHEFRLPVVS